MLSHPAWVCGLKLAMVALCLYLKKVTPCVGVWIETSRGEVSSSNGMSHPAWVCGLKPLRLISRALPQGHTLRGCVD